jgi:thiosulfate reductase cytochrome b subunit
VVDRPGPPRGDPLEAQLAPADDRLRSSQWIPPRSGTFPQVRIGRRWFSAFWAVPLGGLLLIVAIAVGQELLPLPAVQEFVARHPGTVSSVRADYSGHPAWLRWQHFLNLLFMTLIIRAGIQILADHPRLYWNRDCTPGTEWFRFQHEVPRDRPWTAKDDSVTLPGWLGIPGLRHSIGLARWWHFSFDLLWVLNGAIFYVLLLATHQWQRLVPTSWEIFPNALSTVLQYLSLRLPPNDGWVYFNALQKLTYFVTVFVAAPIAIASGLLQAPAISNRLGPIGRLVNRQAARSLHFMMLCWFVLFVCVHVAMVFVTGLRHNVNHMFAGRNDASPLGLEIFALAMAVVLAVWVWASPFTLRYPRLVQKAGRLLVGPLKALGEWWDVSGQYTEADVSPWFWVNGTPPASPEYDALRKDGFAGYALRVDGLVENPRHFSLAELRAMPKQEQITAHFCIQGWSGVARWGGVPVRDLLALVRPLPEARFVVFYSLAEGAEGGRYYDVHSLENMHHSLSILAYEMNGRPLGVAHGAPLRLRCENELGFKHVKWIEAMELVADFRQLGAGQGGYNEDHEFYGYRMPI